MTQIDFDYSRYPETPGYKETGGASQDAASAIKEKAKSLKQRVYNLFYQHKDLTYKEVVKLLNEPSDNVKPRLSELIAEGKIEKTEERRQRCTAMRIKNDVDG